MASLSSNPWVKSPADVALNPVLSFVKKYRESRNLPIESGPSEQPRSSFIAQLRQADAISARKRAVAYQEYVNHRYPEIRESAETMDELAVLATKLARYFERYGTGEDIRESYFHVIRANQVAWDDLSLENKGKMIQTLRHAVQSITTLNKNRVQSSEVIEQCKTYEDVLARTSILDESKNFDDYLLEDLHEVITESANLLTLFSNNPKLQDRDGAAANSVGSPNRNGGKDVETF